jgi:superfamily II DNA/RNA helicase
VLSRGIDIKEINLVVNFDAPSDAEDYVHRVGRTARADTTGVAITLVTKDDMFKLRRIEKLIGYQVFRAPLPDFLPSCHGDTEDRRPSRPRTGNRKYRRR